MSRLATNGCVKSVNTVGHTATILPFALKRDDAANTASEKTVSSEATDVSTAAGSTGSGIVAADAAVTPLAPTCAVAGAVVSQLKTAVRLKSGVSDLS